MMKLFSENDFLQADESALVFNKIFKKANHNKLIELVKFIKALMVVKHYKGVSPFAKCGNPKKVWRRNK